MELKKCPRCNKYSVSYDYNRGMEMCRWRDCNWINTENKKLEAVHSTVITTRANGKKKPLLLNLSWWQRESQKPICLWEMLAWLVGMFIFGLTVGFAIWG